MTLRYAAPHLLVGALLAAAFCWGEHRGHATGAAAARADVLRHVRRVCENTCRGCPPLPEEDW